MPDGMTQGVPDLAGAMAATPQPADAQALFTAANGVADQQAMQGAADAVAASQLPENAAAGPAPQGDGQAVADADSQMMDLMNQLDVVIGQLPPQMQIELFMKYMPQMQRFIEQAAGGADLTAGAPGGGQPVMGEQ